MTATQDKQLLDLDGMAHVLNVTPRGLRYLATTGKVPFHRVGNQLRFDPDEVLKATRGKPARSA